MNQPQLPKGFTLLETQVAGHTFSSNTTDLGMLRDESVGCVLKPMGKPQCGERELWFYESLQTASDPELVKARELVPLFYNKVKLVVNSKEHTFLKMEDLSHRMKKPCIMDIKIGKRTWDPLASPHKRQVEEQKYLHSKQVLGLCLPGFHVYTNEGELLKFGKDYGKQLDTDGLRHAIQLFLNAQHKVCRPLIQELLRQLYKIRDWFSKQKLLHFYASSLLIVYDYEALNTLQQYDAQQQHQNGLTTISNGDAQSNHINSNLLKDDCLVRHTIEHSNNKSETPSDFIKVRMIDFAHVFPAEDEQLDINYLFGLENLIRIIEEFNN